jgi:hypothetical protein
MCNIFLFPEPSSTHDASLSTAERHTTGVKDDEALIIPAAANEAEARTVVITLGNNVQLFWSHYASGEAQADMAYYASVENDDVDSDYVTDEDDDHRVPIVVTATPPPIELQHDTAKRLAGLRHMRKLVRCQLRTQMISSTLMTACSSTI